MERNQIIVGNIGTVLSTDSDLEARKTFVDYREMSANSIGRASGEDVIWMRDDEIYREYTGHLAEAEND